MIMIIINNINNNNNNNNTRKKRNNIAQIMFEYQYLGAEVFCYINRLFLSLFVAFVKKKVFLQRITSFAPNNCKSSFNFKLL